MKSVLKSFSKKAVALVLALAVIICTLSVSLSVFADDTYNVSYASPAIPMVVNTKIGFNAVAVQLTDGGSYVSGDQLTWTYKGVSSGVTLSTAKKTITARATGTYAFTVSDGVNSKDVFVLIAETAEGPFNIFEYDFSNYDADVAAGKSPWKAQAYKKSGTDWSLGEKTLAWNISKGGVALPGEDSSTILYVADDSVIKNFKNYTINFTGLADGAGLWRSIGVIARLGLDATTKLATDASAFVAATVANNNGAGSVLFRTTGYKYKRDAVDFGFAYATNTMYDYSYEFTDNDVIMSAAAAGGELTQYYKLSEDTITPEIPATTGTVGLYVEDITGYFSKFSVSIDVGTSLPVTLQEEDSGLYEIKNNAPAIATTVLKQIDLNNTVVEFGAEQVPGSDITWETTASGITLDGKTLRTFKKGTFKLTATYEGVTKNIYVVVKEENETEWELYSKAFTAGELPSDWSAQYWNTDDKTWVDITQASTATANPHPGLIPFDHNTPGATVYQTHGMLTLNNDVVADFSDYTIDLQAVFYGHLDSNGSFVYGRANTTNGKLTTDSNMYGFTVDTRKTDAAPYTKASYTTYTLNKFTPTEISKGVTDWTCGLVKFNDQYQAPMRNWIVKFEGDKGTLYDAQDAAANHVFSYTGIPETKGTVGIGTFVLYSGGLSGWTKINTVKIKLNNDVEEIPSTKIDAYFIKDSAPVIPMDFLTTADMSKTLIEIDGAFYPGSEITFTSTNDAVVIDNDKDTISARGIGAFPVTASIDGVSRTVYVVAKEASKNEWILYSQKFTENVIPENWTLQYWSTKTKQFYDVTTLTTNTTDTVPSQPGIIPFFHDTVKSTLPTDVDPWKTHGFMVLKNDYLADFADYTVDVQMIAYGHNDLGEGILTRVETDSNGKLNTATSTFSYFENDNGRQWSAQSEAFVSYNYYFGNALAYTPNLGGKTWKYGFNTKNISKYSVKMSGSTGTFWSPEDTENNKFTQTGIAVNKGTVGVAVFTAYDSGYSNWIKLQSITVKLNDDTIPVPTSGTAEEVEAVKKDNPILNVKPGEEKALDSFYVEVDGSFYVAKDLTWQADPDSVSWTDALAVSSTGIKGTKESLYKAVVTTGGGKQATVYIHVKDTAKVPEDEYEDNGNYAFTVDANGNLKSYSRLYEGLPYSQKVMIPAKVDGVTATNVNTNLFNGNETICSVYFEEGVTSVGDSAFSNAKFLKYVYFPTTLEKLDEWSFNGTAIKKVSLPASLVSWSKNSFANTTTIEEVNIATGIKTFPAAFNKMPVAKELKLPYTITKVDSDALKAFTAIEKLYVYNRDAVLDGTQLKAGDTVTIYGATYASDGTSPSTAKALAEANDNKFVPIDDEIKAIEDELKAQIEAEKAKIEQMAATEDTNAVYNFRYDIIDNSATKHFLNNFNPDDETKGVAGKYVIPSVGTSYGINYKTTPSSLSGDKEENANITKIGSNAMKNSSEKGRIYNLVISEGYVSVGDSAFYGLTNMRYLTLPNSLVTIYNYAFSEAVSLKKLNIPDKVSTIGKSAFSGATALTEIKLDVDRSALYSIGEGAFANAAVKSIELPVSTSVIGKKAFAGSALSEVYIYNTEAQIGEEAFPYGCKIYCVAGSTAEQYAIDNGYDYSATLPDKIKIKLITEDKNAQYLFRYDETNNSADRYYLSGINPDDATFLEAGKYTIPSVGTAYGITYKTEPASLNGDKVENAKITSIASNALKNNSEKNRIYSLVISEGYTKIGDSAFYGLTNMRELSLPSTLTSIAGYAFSDAINLKSLQIPDSVSSIGNSAFSNASSLKEIKIDVDNSSLATIGVSAFSKAQITTIKLPVATRQIGKKAFADSALKEVYIYNTKAEIGEQAFPEGCKIYCVAGSTAEQYAKDNGYKYSATLPDKLEERLTTVDKNAEFKISYGGGLYGISGYKGDGGKVVIPTTADYTDESGAVTKNVLISKINSNAFKNSPSKGKIYALEISDGVAVIGDSAFYGCSNLMRLTLPNSIVKIEAWAFTSCALEGTVKLGPNCSFVGQSAFASNPNLEGIYIYNSTAKLEKGCVAKSTTIYGIAGSTAEKYAKENGNKFVKVNPLPEETINDIEDNGNYIFKSNGSGGIQSYERKDENKDYSAKVTFPAKLNGETMTVIASNIFKGRPYTMTIQAAVFEEGIEVIGDSAFASASRLKYVSLPKSLKEIQDWAFMSCDLRGDLVLGENVTKIGNGSFQNNKNLRSITVKNPKASISPGAFIGVREGFILRGLDNSTLYDFYVKNKKNGFVWESIGVYDKPADEGTTPNEGDGETDTDNKEDTKQPGQTQQNKGDSLFATLSSMLGMPEDLTMLIVLALAGGMLLLILIAIVIIVLVAISGDDDDDDDDDFDDDFDDDDFDDDDFDDDDFDDDDFDDDDFDDDFDEEIGDEE